MLWQRGLSDDETNAVPLSEASGRILSEAGFALALN